MIPVQFNRNVNGLYEKLCKIRVGIIGCGGLGSNVAISLARSGVENFTICDFDKVEATNLNRQHFFLDDIGLYKVNAIEKYLKGINLNISLNKILLKIDSDNITGLFDNCDIIVEAVDLAETKKTIIEYFMNFSDTPVISGSGISGYGQFEELKIKKIANLYVCGDQTTDMSEGLCCPRIHIVANMQANLVIELLMKKF
ncbi:MAG: sulfur carrier protein ThiS adenylyltransferase ThiF [Candidatus Delongbacteria bacterium]|nr:sulfur carrier protein ThiS adenylyltransferase ThiF [Candidatus Delongbacteria bacterium]MBN2836407.1 sulfur carrier protein ThiS adenylyltransferase ThiF [Candidatus Delongbacteria bacterium]